MRLNLKELKRQKKKKEVVFVLATYFKVVFC